MTKRMDGLDGFIRQERPPTSAEEQRTIARRSEREWQESKQLVGAFRAYAESQQQASLPLALGIAAEAEAHWAAILTDQFGVVPPQWDQSRRLTETERGHLVTAVWNFTYWRLVTERIAVPMAVAVDRGENGYSAGWQAFCDICENQAEELDGGLVRYAAQLGIGTSLPTAALAGYAAAGLSLRRNQRLRSAVAEGAQIHDTSPDDELLNELQSVAFLSASNPRPGQRFINQVAAELEVLGRRLNLEPLDDNLESFRASEAAAAPFTEAEDRMLLDQLESHAGLAPREREVWALLRQGLPQTEIAERLGLASGTVKSTASRARKKLRAAAS